MNQQERYELLTKLSEFYVKEVKYNLGYFNKVKFISRASIACVWSILSLFILGPCVFLIDHIWIDIPERILSPTVIFLFIAIYLFCFLIEYLKTLDKKNSIQVLVDSDGKNKFIPLSADNEIKKRLMSKFVSLFGDFTWSTYYTPSKFEKRKISVEGLNILKNPLKLFDDYIEGVYKGVNLTMVDGDTLILKSHFLAVYSLFLFLLGMYIPILGVTILVFIIIFLFKYITSKQFKGLVVEIDMNKDFEGHTFILEKNNVKDNLTVDRGKYQEVNLEDIEFSNEYNVYSQNQIEARYILTTAFMERLKNIKETFKAKYVRASFKDKKIVILIHTGRDMFNLGNFLSDIGEKTFVQCFEEICSVLDLVEELKLNENLGL